MLLIKFQDHRSIGSGEEDFLKVFTIYRHGGLVVHMTRTRALIPLFGNGAGAFRIGKNSVVLTKIGKMYKVLCIEEFIVRLI